jgi:hypothetical protein
MAGALAFLMSFDRAHDFVTQADPRLKALLGGGLFFLAWLVHLWDDLVFSDEREPVAKVPSDDRPASNTVVLT